MAVAATAARRTTPARTPRLSACLPTTATRAPISAAALCAVPQRQAQPVVYLLHFDTKLRHAEHYIGYSEWLPARLQHHLAGRGSRLMAAVAASNIGVTVARVWAGANRDFERRLHNRNGAKAICPVCSGAVAFERAPFAPAASEVIE